MECPSRALPVMEGFDGQQFLHVKEHEYPILSYVKFSCMMICAAGFLFPSADLAFGPSPSNMNA